MEKQQKSNLTNLKVVFVLQEQLIRIIFHHLPSIFCVAHGRYSMRIKLKSRAEAETNAYTKGYLHLVV